MVKIVSLVSRDAFSLSLSLDITFYNEIVSLYLHVSTRERKKAEIVEEDAKER